MQAEISLHVWSQASPAARRQCVDAHALVSFQIVEVMRPESTWRIFGSFTNRSSGVRNASISAVMSGVSPPLKQPST